MSGENSIVWRRSEAVGAGHEFARLFAESSKRFLEGAAIFVFEKQFCKLDYRIECDANWQTVGARDFCFVGAEKIEIKIVVDDKKRWTINGAENIATANCADVDLNFSLVTNALPVRRLKLKIGEKKAVQAAWLRFPSFKLELLEQTYGRIGENSYIYESANGAFRAEIETDDFGLATRYGDFWEIEK